MRIHLVFMTVLAANSPGWASGSGHTNCSRWIGQYVATLRPSDSFTGDATRLSLSIDKRGVSWSVSGEAVPEILLAADHYQCRPTGVSGSFSGAQLKGDFRLSMRDGGYVFDASRVGNEAAPINNIGYVPNRAVRIRKVR